MTRKAVIYLLAGLICAVGAVILARRYIPPQDASGATGPPTTNVLVASKPIEFGTPIVYIKSDKESGNAGFAPLPEQYVPEGAITSRKELDEQKLIATSRFVRYQPILRSMVQPRDRFLPADAFLEYFSFDPDEVTGVAEGERIDILKIGRDKTVEPFIRCALVYSIGAPPRAISDDRSSDKEHPDRVYVLLPKQMREKVIEAKLKLDLIVRESIETCDEKKLAQLVQDPRAIRIQKATGILREAEALLEAQQYEAAEQRIEQILQKYPELPQAQKAGEAREKVRAALAGQKLSEARNAYQEEAYERAIRLGEELADQYSDLQNTKKEALNLVQKARQEHHRIQTRQRYRELLGKLRDALRTGNLPRMKGLLTQLQEKFADLETGPGLKGPDQVQEELGERLEDLQREFHNDYRVLNYHLIENNQPEAVQKLHEMEEKFAAHPRLQRARRQMQKKGWLQ
jgi:hypothetical protein